MKTGTVAILASCLLGQAIAAPAILKVRTTNVPAKVDDVTKGAKHDTLGSLGPDGGSISGSFKNGIGHSERGIEGSDVDSLVQAIAPVLQTAGGAASGAAAAMNSKRGMDQPDLDTLLRTLAPVLETAGGAAAGAAESMSHKRDVEYDQINSLLHMLAPVLDQTGKATSGAADTLANVKRALDPAQIDALLKAIAPIMETAGSAATGAAQTLSEKRAVDPAQVDALLKAIAPIMETAGSAATGAAQSMAGKRAIDPAQIDALLKTLAPVVDTAGKAATGAAETLGKRDSDDRNYLLFGNLGDIGAPGVLPSDIDTVTDEVSKKIDSNIKGAASEAADTAGLGKRNLLEDLGIKEVLGTLSTGLTDTANAQNEAQAVADDAKAEANDAITGATDMALEVASDASNAAGLGLIDGLAKELGLYDTVSNTAKSAVGGITEGLAKRGDKDDKKDKKKDKTTFLANVAPAKDKTQAEKRDDKEDKDDKKKDKTTFLANVAPAKDKTQAEKREALSLDPADVLEVFTPFLEALEEIQGSSAEKRDALPLDPSGLLGVLGPVLGQLQNADIGINEDAGNKAEDATTDDTTTSTTGAKRSLLSGGLDPTTLLAALAPVLGDAVDLDTGSKKNATEVDPDTAPKAAVGKRSLSDLIALFKALGPLIEQLRDRERTTTSAEPTATPTPGATTDLEQLLALPTLL